MWSLKQLDSCRVKETIGSHVPRRRLENKNPLYERVLDNNNNAMFMRMRLLHYLFSLMGPVCCNVDTRALHVPEGVWPWQSSVSSGSWFWWCLLYLRVNILYLSSKRGLCPSYRILELMIDQTRIYGFAFTASSENFLWLWIGCWEREHWRKDTNKIIKMN